MNSPYTNFRQLLESLDSIETQDALVPHEDHEINMAHVELLNLMRNSTELYDMLRGQPEGGGLPAWVQVKIAQANGMLESVTEYMREQHVQQTTGDYHEGYHFMDLKKLLESLDSMAEDAILDKPHSSKRFTDQVSGTDKARRISVLGNPAGDPKHPFQGKLVGGCAEADQHLDEDLIQQLTREFAEFLKNPTVVDEAGISDTQKTGPLAPVAGKPAAPANAAPANAAPANAAPANALNVDISAIATQLGKMMPGIKYQLLAPAIKAGAKRNAAQNAVLAQAFALLAAMNPQQTTTAMALLKKVESKPTALEESSKKRCMQCGMKNCTCEQGKCKCKPIAGWIPNKGFKKTTEQVVDEAKSSKLLTRAQHNDTPEKRKQQGRCVSCGQSLSTAGRGTADRCKECSN